MPTDPHSQGDVLGELQKGPHKTQLQPHYEEQCEDQLDKCSNDEERELSNSRETMQTRKCRKVAEQLGSRISQE